MRYSYGLILFLVICAVGALVLPPGVAGPLRNIDSLLEPVSFPVRHIAGRLSSKFGGRRPTPGEEAAGSQTLQKVTDEKQALITLVEMLTSRNEELQVQLKDFRSIDKDDPVRVVPVVSAEPGLQQVLVVQAIDGLASKMVAKSGVRAMAGQVEVVGIGAAHVRLITDKASAITANFRRYKPEEGFTTLPQLPKVVRGTGDGKMVIVDMRREEALPKAKEDQLAVGDWVRVFDKDLPRGAQGLKLGEIESIKPAKMPLFVTIVIRPDTDLMKLSEVMVMMKK